MKLTKIHKETEARSQAEIVEQGHVTFLSKGLLEKGRYFSLGLDAGFYNWLKKPEICNYFKLCGDI